MINTLSAQQPTGYCFMPLQTQDRGYLGFPDQFDLWKSQVIPYTFSADFPQTGRDKVLAALYTLQQNTNLCFVPHRTEQHKITVKPFSNSLYSYADFNDQSLNLSSYDSSVVIHEVGHLLGLAHEHQRPDRGQYVAVQYQNIIPGFESAFDIIPATSNTRMSQEYDLKSIMHYPSWAFSKNGAPTITDVGFNQFPYNTKLSTGDTAFLNARYPLKIDCQQAAEERPPKADFSMEPPEGVCSYTFIIFKNTSVGATDLEWSAPGGVPESGRDSVFTTYFPQDKTYTVTLTAYHASYRNEKQISLNVAACILPAIDSLSPNPARHYLDVTLSRMLPQVFTARILGMNGQELQHLTIAPDFSGSKSFRVQLPTLPSGVYVLALDVYDTVLARRFVVH